MAHYEQDSESYLLEGVNANAICFWYSRQSCTVDVIVVWSLVIVGR